MEGFWQGFRMYAESDCTCFELKSNLKMVIKQS